MVAKNCPRCGKVFTMVSDPICKPCMKEEEEIFEKVREFVKENQNSSIKEVSDACEVSTKKILQYIRDGKLEAGIGMTGEILCSKCGRPIVTGRMCDTCRVETGNQVKDMKEQARIKNKGRLHVDRKSEG